MDIDKSPKTSDKYKVNVVPYLIIFKDGKSVATQSGFMSKSELTKWIKKNS